MYVWNEDRGKNFFKCSLVLRTSTPKSLLVLLPNKAGHSRKYNLVLYFFYLSVGHWMKIYTFPGWNFTCPGLQDKWFFYPWKTFMWIVHWCIPVCVLLDNGKSVNLLIFEGSIWKKNTQDLWKNNCKQVYGIRHVLQFVIISYRDILLWIIYFVCLGLTLLSNICGQFATVPGCSRDQCAGTQQG